MLKKAFFIAIIFLATGFTRSEVVAPLDIVFCMDLSASTNGLISDVRDNLWMTIEACRFKYPEHNLRIGVVVYARPSFKDNSGYVKILSDLTNDFDLVSHELFALKVNVENGNQYVGNALKETNDKISWSKNKSAVKIVYLMGNGKVNTGYDYMKASEQLSEKNIKVNTVYCVQQKLIGSDLLGYIKIAQITGGQNFTYPLIAKNALGHLSADAKGLRDLNGSWTETYIAYGREGSAHYKLMQEADRNAASREDMFFYWRMRFKLSAAYEIKNSEWDVVSSYDLNSNSPEYKLPIPDLTDTTPEKLLALVKYKSEVRKNYVKDMEKVVPVYNADTTGRYGSFNTMLYKGL